METRAVVFDMEGILVPGLYFWEKLHTLAGSKAWMDENVPRYLRKEISYRELNLTSIRLFKESGTTLREMHNVASKAPIMRGARETIKALRKEFGSNVALVSGGLDILADRIAKKLKIKYVMCNTLEIVNGDYTGRVIYSIDNARRTKATALRELCKEMRVLPKYTAVVGDSREDIPMFKAAGFSIAFNPLHGTVAKAADVIVESNNLKDILKHLK